MMTINIKLTYSIIPAGYQNPSFYLCKDKAPQNDDSVFRTLNKIRKILKYQYKYMSPKEDEFSKKPLKETYLFLIKTAHEIYKRYLYENMELPIFSYLINNQEDIIRVKNKINGLVAPKGRISDTYGCTHAGENEVHLAVRARNLSWLKLLQEKGNPIDAKDFDGRTPFYVCFCTLGFCKSKEDLKNTLEIAQFLLDNGANINHQSHAPHYQGYTALHHAVHHRNSKSVKMLLQNRANPNIQENTLQRTPLHLAFEKKDKDSLQLLMVYGANLTIQDSRGLTPIDFEFKQDRENLIESYYYNLLMLTLQNSFIAGYHSVVPKLSEHSISHQQHALQEHLISVCLRKHELWNPIQHHCRMDTPYPFVHLHNASKSHLLEIYTKAVLEEEKQKCEIAFNEGQQKGNEKKRFDEELQNYSRHTDPQNNNQAVNSGTVFSQSKEFLQHLKTINPNWKNYEECLKLYLYDVKDHNPYNLK